MRRPQCLLLLPLLLVLAACEKASPTDPSTDDIDNTGGSGSLQNGSMSATVDGNAFTATSLTTFNTLGGSVSPAVLTATGASGTRTIAFSLSGTGIGTFSVGAGDVNFVIAEGLAGQSWQGITGAAGSSGTVTLTIWTPSRAVGTFSVMATPTPGTGASGNRVVTNGRFDLTF
jgi:hypothetical protein